MSKLSKKYKWLLTEDPYYDEEEDMFYDAMDCIPTGWVVSFGELFCEEMDAAIKEVGFENEFKIIQMKEKFGAMRCYVTHDTPKIYDIIRKYEVLSENICSHCGKPDVAMTDTGWQIPLCKECFEAYLNTNLKYEDAVRGRDTMSNEVKWSQWRHDDTLPKGGEWENCSQDISETAERIRKAWEEKSKTES